MENKNMLYFRTQADEANNDGIDDSVCLPAANLVSISPTANNTVAMYFKSVKSNDPLAAHDSVILDTIVGDAFEVAQALIQHVNSGPRTNGFIVIADDMTTTDSAVAALNDKAHTPVYAHPSITGVNAINVSQDVLTKHDYSFGLHYGVAPTAIAAGALTVNTHYTNGETGNKAYTIPSAAATRAGDWISILYTADIGNGSAHTYTTTTDTTFALGSHIVVPGEDATRVTVVDTAVAADNVLTITGLTNGDGGKGTRIMLRNMTGEVNGWGVEAVVLGQGAMSAASADTAFS